MGDVTIRLRVQDDGSLTLLDTATEKLKAIDSAAQQGSTGTNSFGLSLTDLKSGFDILKGGATTALNLVDSINSMGVAALRSKAGFEAMAGTHADEFLRSMQDATKGLVDDSELAQIGMRALSSQAITSGKDLADMAHTGAILGLTFQGSAEGGVQALELALEQVGNARGLRQLGINTEEVKNRFEELKKTMSDQDAWRMAVLEKAGDQAKALSGALDGTGTALERFKVAAADAFESFAEKVATGLDNVLKLVDALNMLGAIDNARAADKVNYAIPDAAKDTNYLNEFSKTHASQAGYGFAALGMSPGDYYGGLAGYQYGDNAKYPTKNTLQAGQYTPPPMWTPQYTTDPRTDTQDYLVRHPDQRNFYGADGGFNPFGGRDFGGAGYFQSAAQGPDNGAIQGFQNILHFIHEAAMDTQIGAEKTAGMFSPKGFSDQSSADQKIEMEGFKNILHLGHDAAMDFKIGLEKTFKPLEDFANKNAKAAQIQSINDAFGIGPKDGLYGEVGGGMQQTQAQARAAEEERLKKQYGAWNTKKIDQGLSAFDASAKAGTDKFNIDTGQATEASIKYRDTIASINKAYVDGKIGGLDYAKMMEAIAKSAKDGTTNIQEAITSIQLAQKTTQPKGHGLDKDLVDLKGQAAGTTPVDPTKDLQTKMDKLNTSASDFKTAIDNLPTTSKTQFDKAADSVKPLQDRLEATQKTMNRLLTNKSTFIISIQQYSAGGNTQVSQ